MDCQPSLLAWGDASLIWIAEHLRATWLTPIMAFISDLGHKGPILFMIALGYWFWNKRAMRFIGYGMFSSLLFNYWLKGVIMECRPPAFLWLEQVKNSYSFPSGHAQVTIVLWAGLAYYLYHRSKVLSLFCLFIGLMIAISRPYLGVHYVHDIVVGLLLGLGILGLSILFEKKHLQPLRAFSLWAQASIFIFALSVYGLIVNHPSGNYLAGCAALFGFWLGCQWETRKLQFQTPTNLFSQLCLCVVGIGGALLLWKGIEYFTKDLEKPVAMIAQIVQYTLLGIWVTFGAPAFISAWDKRRKTALYVAS